MKVVNILIWGTLVFLLGMWYQAHLAQRQANKKAESLLEARSSAASCYWIMGDHWMKFHPDYPGSAAIAGTSFDLSMDFQAEIDRDKCCPASAPPKRP